ncbi:hypothetical protein [Nocardia sp. NPDC052316]|uniref:hypothetical protein n=1 Tax=Nocardia sp. NPDC052316 TaxID=3364329 RepID=UPI0037CA7F2E
MIQDEAPYETRGNILPHSTAVRMIDDDRLDYEVYFGVYQSGHTVFNPRTRQKICQNQEDFATALKRVAVENKGSVKACCATEDGMQQFFDKKLNDNIALSLRESPEDVEKVIDEMAKKAAERETGRPYEDLDAEDKEEADEVAKDYKENFLDTIGLTPEKLADAKASQPDKYKDKWPCNPDSDGNCQYL